MDNDENRFDRQRLVDLARRSISKPRGSSISLQLVSTAYQSRIASKQLKLTYTHGVKGRGEMPSRSSTADYPLQTLSHRSSLNLGSLSRDRLEPEAGPSSGGTRMIRGNSGKRSKKRLSDGGEENEALLGDSSRGFEDDLVC